MLCSLIQVQLSIILKSIYVAGSRVSPEKILEKDMEKEMDRWETEE